MILTNIKNIANLIELKSILESNTNVILGISEPETSCDKISILQQFLEEKSELYPHISFVYMKYFLDKECNELNIFPREKHEYPLLYHIMHGNNILVAVTNANKRSLNESFDIVKNVYEKNKY